MFFFQVNEPYLNYRRGFRTTKEISLGRFNKKKVGKEITRQRKQYQLLWELLFRYIPLGKIR